MAKARDSKGQFASGNSSDGGSMSHLTLNAIVGQAVHNAQFSQPRGGSNTHGGSPRRDIDDECGFPKRGLITLEDYTYLFERCSIAARVVELEPREAWKASPSVYEDEDSETVTKFEEGLNELGKKLQGESWFETGEDESGSVIWQKLQLIDELSGIGSFGALLLGLDDSDDLSEPAPGIKDDGTSGGGGENTTRELLYLRAYSQTMVKIDGYVTEKSNPRYGLPEYYSIQVAGYDTSSVNSGNLPDTSEIRVHWSRVIHVADIWHQSSASDVFAIPRMRPVYNEVLSCRKIAGASGEFYWNHGSRDLIIETHPQLGGKVRFPSDMKSQIEQFETGLQRSLRLSGASAKTLNPAVSDPTPHLMIQVKLICIKKGCPERIFWGSERGELASSQDERGWADRVMGRQNGYVTPRIIVPFIDRCIQLGVLPKPKQYYVVWPNLRELSPQERAVVVAARVEAMVKYQGGNVYQLMAPGDFLTRELDYTQEETAEILATAQEEEEEIAKRQEELTPEPKFGEEGEQPPGQGKGKKKEGKEDREGKKKGGPTTHAYNPSQPRDAQGKFGSGGGGGGGSYEQQQKEWEDSLDENEVTAIDHYTGLGYKRMRECQSVGKGCNQQTKEMVYDMEEALDRAPAYQGTTYRGVRFESSEEVTTFVATVKANGGVVDRGFLSTTRDSSVAREFAGGITAKRKGVLLSIKSKSGVDVSAISSQKSEKEVVMFPDSRLQLKRVSKSRGVVTLHLEEE